MFRIPRILFNLHPYSSRLHLRPGSLRKQHHGLLPKEIQNESIRSAHTHFLLQKSFPSGSIQCPLLLSQLQKVELFIPFRSPLHLRNRPSRYSFLVPPSPPPNSHTIWYIPRSLFRPLISYRSRHLSLPQWHTRTPHSNHGSLVVTHLPSLHPIRPQRPQSRSSTPSLNGFFWGGVHRRRDIAMDLQTSPHRLHDSSVNFIVRHTTNSLCQ